jgi:hypothetical protein
MRRPPCQPRHIHGLTSPPIDNTSHQNTAPLICSVAQSMRCATGNSYAQCICQTLQQRDARRNGKVIMRSAFPWPVRGSLRPPALTASLCLPPHGLVTTLLEERHKYERCNLLHDLPESPRVTLCRVAYPRFSFILLCCLQPVLTHYVDAHSLTTTRYVSEVALYGSGPQP